MKQSFFLVAIVALFSCNSSNKADRIYVNGNIWTGDTANPTASVIAIKGDKIIYVGNDPAKVTGQDGNVFNLIAICTKALKKAGQNEAVKEMQNKVFQSDSYHSAIAVMSEYCELC